MNRINICWPVLIITLVLSGCGVSDPAPIISQELNMVAGEPVNVLYSKLGHPTYEGKVAGNKFYAWTYSTNMLVPSFATTNGYGTFGQQPFNYSESSYGVGGVAQLSCTLRIFVNKQDLIGDRDIHGPRGACQYFAERLK